MAAADAFADVVKGTHRTRLRDMDLTWIQMLLTGFLIVKVLKTQAKFLKPSDYRTVVNCFFTFHFTKVFSCFFSVLIQHKFLN